MATATRTGSVTFEEFCVLIRPKQKADLLNGVIYIASPENMDAGRLFVWLLCVIAGYIEHQKLGEVFGSRIAFRLGPKQGPEPDLAFVKKERLHLVQETYFEGPPDLAIEIVSPESVERDYEKKRLVYQQAGVAEYWIIDEDLKKVTLLRLDRRGKYREIRPRQGVLASQVITGFWLRPEWLWEATRTSKAEALAQILSAKPSVEPSS
ncbi:MAG: Uma2 family endonuclease [Planctomycetes bacterium]|nr:Uma2 family endonuclease [Planctomycetota bacterium]